MREGYKMTELGEIPASWDLVKLESITNKIGDGLHSTPNYVHSSKYYFVNGNNLVNGNLDIKENAKCISEEEFNKYFRDFGENTILMSINGTIGNIAYYRGEKVVFGKSASFITCGQDLDKSFLFYLLQSSFIKKFYAYELTGSTINNLSLKSIRNTPIPLPKKVEQKKIAEILSTVDDKIEVIENQINQTQQLKKGLMQQLLIKGIGHTKFKDSPLGEIPDTWDLASVKEVTSEHKQGYYTKNEYINDGVRLVRITDLKNPTVDFSEMPSLKISEKEYSDFKIELGDFLFARSGAIGRYGIVEKLEYPAIFASYLIKFKFNNQKLVNRFFGYFYESGLCSTQLKGIAQGNANINIKAENIKSLKLPFPPLVEQQKIADILIAVDEKLSVLQLRKAAIIELKKGLMQQLLTGKLRVEIF